MKKRFQTIVASAKQKFSLSISSVKLAVVATAICCLTPINAFADKVGDYNAGITALGEVEKSLKDYIEPVTKVCYALAGIFAIIGAISVYIAMNNEEQDVKKKIMMTVGACIFLIAAAQALPAFFTV